MFPRLDECGRSPKSVKQVLRTMPHGKPDWKNQSGLLFGPLMIWIWQPQGLWPGERFEADGAIRPAPSAWFEALITHGIKFAGSFRRMKKELVIHYIRGVRFASSYVGYKEMA